MHKFILKIAIIGVAVNGGDDNDMLRA